MFPFNAKFHYSPLGQEQYSCKFDHKAKNCVKPVEMIDFYVKTPERIDFSWKYVILTIFYRAGKNGFSCPRDRKTILARSVKISWKRSSRLFDTERARMYYSYPIGRVRMKFSPHVKVKNSFPRGRRPQGEEFFTFTRGENSFLPTRLGKSSILTDFPYRERKVFFPYRERILLTNSFFPCWGGKE